MVETCEPHWKMPQSPFTDLLVFQPPSTETTCECSVSLTQNVTHPFRKTSP